MKSVGRVRGSPARTARRRLPSIFGNLAPFSCSRVKDELLAKTLALISVKEGLQHTADSHSLGKAGIVKSSDV